MTTWHQRLKQAYLNKKDSSGITQETLAADMNVSQSTIAAWISGKRQPVGLDQYQKLAGFLDVDSGWLMNGTESDDPNLSVPLLTPDMVSKWHKGHKVNTSTCRKFTIDLPFSDDRTYAITATDDSMEPRVCVGDTVFISPSSKFEPGKLIAVDFRGDGYLTIGKLITSGRNYYLSFLSNRIDITYEELSDMYRGTVVAVLMSV